MLPLTTLDADGIIYSSVHKRRPLAYGVIATGSSIGGVIFPLAVRHLLQEVGCASTVYFAKVDDHL